MNVGKWMMRGLMFGMAGWLASCSGDPMGVRRSVPPVSVEESPSGGGDADLMGVPEKRTGIATGWGREVESRMTYRNFVRSSDKPRGISILRYNDAGGAEAMGVDHFYVPSALQKAADGLVEWGMVGRWGTLSHAWWRGDRFVIGQEGREYQIKVRNLCDARLEVVLSVDGLDVMDGQPASIKKRGYLIAPGREMVVSGFRTSEEKVASFKFSSVGSSYANLRHGETRNVGVVGLAVFTEKGREPGVEKRVRGRARAFAEAPAVQGR